MEIKWVDLSSIKEVRNFKRNKKFLRINEESRGKNFELNLIMIEKKSFNYKILGQKF